MIDKHEEREKYYLKLIKRDRELMEQKRNMPYRDLKEPIHSGWFLELNLSDQALKAKGGEQLQKALELSRKEFVTHEIKKIPKIRQNKTLAEVRKLFTTSTFFKKTYSGPGLIEFTEKEFKEKIPEDLRKWFREIKRERYNGNHKGRLGFSYDLYYKLDIDDTKLVCKIRKRILTKVKDINPKLESELKWLEMKLEDYWRERKGANTYNRKSKTWASGRESVQGARKHIRQNIHIFMTKNIPASQIVSFKKAGRNKHTIK